MSHIHICREHHLGLPAARKFAAQWLTKVEQEFDLQCVLQKGKDHDQIAFKRVGLTGHLMVSATQFELRAQLGMLLGVFKHRIESEIVRNLDDLLASPQPTRKKKT
jgi:putative polyhydroxyalkanoate system protein